MHKNAPPPPTHTHPHTHTPHTHTHTHTPGLRPHSMEWIYPLYDPVPLKSTLGSPSWYITLGEGVEVCVSSSLNVLQDTFDTRILLASPANHVINFSTAHESDLHRFVWREGEEVLLATPITPLPPPSLPRMTIPVHFKLFSTGTVHGLAFWFDVCFRGSQ